MKKRLLLNSTLVVLLLLTSLSISAGGGWATSVVNITKDADPAYNFKLNDEGWTDGSWGANNSFQATNFGIANSLILNGGSGNAWTDDSPGYDATSFKIYYRAYATGTTPGAWSSLNLDFLAYTSGNNKIWDKSNANVDILALVGNKIGTYTLEVAMSKNQFYTGGNWNSMVPGGQGTAYDTATAGYTATFQIVTTAIISTNNDAKLMVANKRLSVSAENGSNIELYNISGQSISKSTTSGLYSKQLGSGAYIVKINGKSQKLIIK